MSESPLLRSIDDNHQSIVNIYNNIPGTLITLAPHVTCETTCLLFDEQKKLDDDFLDMFKGRAGLHNVKKTYEIDLTTSPISSKDSTSLYLLMKKISALQWKISRSENWLIRRFTNMSSRIAYAEQTPLCIANTIYVYSSLLLNPIVSHENINVYVRHMKNPILCVTLSIDASVEHLIHHCAVNFNVPAEVLDKCVLGIQGFCEILARDAHLNELQHVQERMRMSEDVQLELFVLSNSIEALTNSNQMIVSNAQRRAERIRSPTDSKQDRLSDKVSIIVDSLQTEASLFGDLLIEEQQKTTLEAEEGDRTVVRKPRSKTVPECRYYGPQELSQRDAYDVVCNKVRRILKLLGNLMVSVRFSSRELDISIDRLNFLVNQCMFGDQMVEAILSTLLDTFSIANRFLNSIFHSYVIERQSTLRCGDNLTDSVVASKSDVCYLSEVRGFVIIEIHSCFHEGLQFDIDQLRQPAEHHGRRHFSAGSEKSLSTVSQHQLEQRFMYRITAELRHNCTTISSVKSTRWVCPSFHDNPAKDRLPPRIAFNDQLYFSEVDACILPRETVIYIQLWRGKLSTERVGWTCLALFDAEHLDFVGNVVTSEERLNELYLGLHPAQDLDCSGGSCYNVLGEKCPIISLAVSLSNSDYVGKTIRFPDVGARADILLFDFQSIPNEVKAKLRRTLRRCNFCDFSDEERQLLWEKRHYLTSFSGALPKVLRSIRNWDCLSLQDTYRLLKEWRHLSPAESIELLLPRFSDQRVRLFAVQSLRTLPTDSLELYLPQLVRAWAYDFNACSPLAELLLSSAARSPTFAHALFWQLKLWLSLDSDPWVFRYLMLAQAMYVVASPVMIEEFKRQNGLVARLNRLSAALKEDQSLLNLETERLSGKLEQTGVRLPLRFSFLTNGVDPNGCHVYKSLRAPVKISFVHNPPHLQGSEQLSSSGGHEVLKVYDAIYKMGDDITQDIVISSCGEVN